MRHGMLILIIAFASGCSASVDKNKDGDITRVTADNAALRTAAGGRESKVQFCYSLTEEQRGEGCSEGTASEKRACARKMFQLCLKGDQ